MSEELIQAQDGRLSMSKQKNGSECRLNVIVERDVKESKRF